MLKKFATLILLVCTAVAASADTVLTNRTVALEWDPNPAADQVTGYILHHSLLSAGPFAPVASVDGSTTNAVHTGVNAGTHFYTLTATNFWGVESPPSEMISTPEVASKVAGLAISRVPAGVQLNWTANPTNQEVTAYRVYTGTDVGNINSFTVASTTTNNVHQEAMAPGFRAFFVTASNYWGEGFRSEIITVPGLPSAPAGLSSKAQ